MIVLAAWTIQATTGFGSTVVALTVGAPWTSIDAFVPVLALLNLPLTAWTTLRHRQHVDREVCLRLVLPWMSIGMVAGLALATQLSGPAFRRGFGAFVLSFALWDLSRVALNRPPTVVQRRATLAPWIVLSGVMHGLYNSGGPALVQATSRLGMDRGAFRATMSAIWLLFNLALNGYWLYTGRLNREVAVQVLWLLPCVPLGVFLGEKLHPVLPERAFRAMVQVVLVIGGAALLM